MFTSNFKYFEEQYNNINAQITNKINELHTDL